MGLREFVRSAVGDIRGVKSNCAGHQRLNVTLSSNLDKMRTDKHLQHAHELLTAHPLIDSHVDLPYVMRAVREYTMNRLEGRTNSNR